MVNINRCQKSRFRRAVNLVDITRKSADGKVAAKLAPEWDWINGMKRRTLSYKGFMQLYFDRLANLGDRIADWLEEKAGHEKTVTLVCYCRDDNVECHTHLAALFFVRRWPDRFKIGQSIQKYLDDEKR